MLKGNLACAFKAIRSWHLLPIVLTILVSSSIDSADAAQTINVKTFGAKGDGATDDQTAIQNAFTAAAQTGATVYFPKGTYLHSDFLVANGIGLDGLKANIVATNAARPTITLERTSSVSNLSIQTRVPVSTTSIAGLSLSATSLNTKLSNVSVRSGFALGVACRGTGTVVSDCNFSSTVPEAALVAVGGNSAAFTRCNFYGTIIPGTTGQYGLVIAGGKNLRITSSNFTNLLEGVGTFSGLIDNNPPEIIQIDNNRMRSVGTGIACGTLTANTFRLIATNNEIISQPGPTLFGIRVLCAGGGKVSPAIVDNNRILNFSEFGIVVAGGVENGRFTRNTITNVNSLAGTGIGLYISNNLGSTISDNQITNTSGEGIRVDNNVGSLTISRNRIANSAFGSLGPVVAAIHLTFAAASVGPIAITNNNYRGNTTNLSYFIRSEMNATLSGNTTTTSLPSKAGP